MIRIGTRDSKLALWQAEEVKGYLEGVLVGCELVAVKSEGDVRLHQPLYAMGVTGIFTKVLDVALLNGEIDLAVHSLKDVPTALPKGIVQAAVLKRGNVSDVLVLRRPTDIFNDFSSVGAIASSSLRRQAQWLHRFPHHLFHDIRGNVPTRLNKLAESRWDGAIFAAAGLERVGIHPAHVMALDWMLPAAGQGAVVVYCREGDQKVLALLAVLSDWETEVCTCVERAFLARLEGGCTAPIGALATISEGRVFFKGNLLSLDGKDKNTIEMSGLVSDYKALGRYAAEDVLRSGGREIMDEVRRTKDGEAKDEVFK